MPGLEGELHPYQERTLRLSRKARERSRRERIEMLRREQARRDRRRRLTIIGSALDTAGAAPYRREKWRRYRP
jgi:hypothetical protein